jgi:hypothetical protein
MKQFYETYSDSKKLAPLVREIGWSHNLVILLLAGFLSRKKLVD